jgi:hypothetical protein
MTRNDTFIGRFVHAIAVAVAMAMATGCGPRVIITTGTTLGLKANPGDAEAGRPPQVTLGYKRAEAAIIPTKGNHATADGDEAYSTYASFGFQTRWFGTTELTSFISSGFAARALVAPDDLAAQAAEVQVPELAPEPPAVAPHAPKGHAAPPKPMAPARSGKNTFLEGLMNKD